MNVHFGARAVVETEFPALHPSKCQEAAYKSKPKLDFGLDLQDSISSLSRPAGRKFHLRPA